MVDPGTRSKTGLDRYPGGPGARPLAAVSSRVSLLRPGGSLVATKCDEIALARHQSGRPAGDGGRFWPMSDIEPAVQRQVAVAMARRGLASSAVGEQRDKRP